MVYIFESEYLVSILIKENAKYRRNIFIEVRSGKFNVS